MKNNVIRFPSRVTGAMRLPDPLDYPHEGEIYTTKVVALVPRPRLSPFELWFAFTLTIAASFLLAWHR